ncbi:hypothetical protein HDU92_005853 [Lobulomyces angularis]|nr:hypothetical protein HDU92_005853 [Lobulomyces angularis]
MKNGMVYYSSLSKKKKKEKNQPIGKKANFNVTNLSSIDCDTSQKINNDASLLLSENERKPKSGFQNSQISVP